MRNKRYERFSKEEERELLYKFKKENDKYAFEKLMRDNRWLVLSIAGKIKKRQRAENELDDLIQEGNIGLSKAIQGFNLEKYRNRISTYAYIKIKQAVDKEIKRREIHIPGHIQENYSNICRTGNFLKERFGKEASLKEISSETGFSVEKIKFIHEKMNISCTYLDAPIYKEGGSRKKSEAIGDISSFSVERLLELKEELEKIMEIVLNTINQFSEKKQSIFYEYFFHNKTFKKIAQEFFCCHSNIGQHIQKILMALCIRLKKNGYEVQKDKIRIWLLGKIDLCCWLQETTGSNFNILK